MPGYTDSDIIAGCLANKEKYQVALYKEHGQMALRVAYRYVNNEDDARDVLQAALIKVFKYLHTFNKQSKLSSWITRIVINESITFLKKKKESYLSLDANLSEELEDIPYQDEDFQLQYAEAINLLNQLPAINRTVFNMYVVDDLSHFQIAEQLGITEANSRQILMRARRQLNKYMLIAKKNNNERNARLSQS